VEPRLKSTIKCKNDQYMSRIKLKWGLIIKASLFIIPLLGLKSVLHFLNLEVISVGPVITALVAGVFFVIAIILSGVLSDFKESEKIPGELTVSIEALYKDTWLLGNDGAVAEMLKHVRELTHIITTNFERKGSWKLTEVNAVIDQIDEDIRNFAGGNSPTALMLKLRNELGNIKRLSNRVEVIKEVSFLPTGHAIAEFATGCALLVMLLLKIEPFYEGLVLSGAIAIILISVVLLIKDMDNPFEGYAKIDLSHLHKLDKYLDSR
jgi:hypothetical protein